MEITQALFDSYTNTIKVLRLIKRNQKQFYELECLTCGNIWDLRKDDLVRLAKNKKGGCRICSNRLIAKNNIKEISMEYMKIIEQYFYIENAIHPVNKIFTCKKCESVFEGRLDSLYGKLKRKQILCGECKKDENLQDISNQIQILKDNDINNIEILERKTFAVSNVKCLKCNHVWDAWFGNIVRAKKKWDTNSCPNCDALTGRTTSSQQIELENLVKQYVDIKSKYKLPNNKEIDIFIPSLSIGIEFNGVYWHSPDTSYRGMDEFYHIDKTKEAQRNGIRLIHIFSPQWIHKKEICKNKILNLIKPNKDYLRSNKYNIKLIDWYTAKNFLIQYHLMGSGEVGLFNYGLFYKDTLVGVATFTNKRKGNFRERDDEVVEFNRFATSVRCYGAISKIINNIKKYYPHIKEIVSYADLCWSDVSNNIYIKNGFELEKITEPNYWWCKNDIFLGRRATMKHKLQKLLGDKFDENKTEVANMLLNGYYRIWDCGHARYRLIL